MVSPNIDIYILAQINELEDKIKELHSLDL